uniref:Uncharacterized protein n=1 Tax=Knipowitschia caucasica TaxID=637954 RepID=A0AAV2J1A2_KNICA
MRQTRGALARRDGARQSCGGSRDEGGVRGLSSVRHFKRKARASAEETNAASVPVKAPLTPPSSGVRPLIHAPINKLTRVWIKEEGGRDGASCWWGGYWK